ncbi:putative HD superfamily hydrolase [Anaerohalosphaera lusitana]|uniref:Putative HD superfamily hydrolase n=1 Tax=Anaerohalosphaera lusitana TaxID=1936003 RepID=A0A1U9NR07_9BACT|nr:hypothetical protein [Anaerohalosphaera lusitana]AQT70158.1 putative HD superfamily hydrolase [Anaerohalosphaera lusitana]
MSKVWKIWIILFVTAGVLGLATSGAVTLVKKSAAASYQQKFPEGTEKHLENYEEILDLAHQPELTEEQLRLFQEKKNELASEQEDLLKADLWDLATGKKQPSVIADFMYGQGWQEKVKTEKTIHAGMEILAIVSTVSLLTGLIVAAGVGVKVATGSARSKHKAKKEVKKANKAAPKLQKDTSKKAAPVERPQEAKPSQKSEDDTEEDEASEPKKKPGLLKAVKTDSAKEHKTQRQRNFEKYKAQKSKEDDLKAQAETSDQKSVEPQDEKPKVGAFSSQRLKQAGLTGVRFGNNSDESTQGGLSQQVAKLQNMMSTAPVKESISELTEQMSAIREFASQQQDRFRQLQDGYDWNIIKRFCLRIIRCIDNLDARLDYLAAEEEDTSDLEEVRDELLFALESSGVEKFTPDLLADYKGLERYAEAVSQREMTEDEDLVGKVAKVVRPGYQYILNDNEIKVVRTAQVKLYSQKLTAVSGVR